MCSATYFLNTYGVTKCELTAELCFEETHDFVVFVVFERLHTIKMHCF